MNKSKALKTAKEYLWPKCMECLFDCSDSAYEAEKLENRFNAYVDDSININEFISKNLRKEYVQALKDALAENGQTLDDEEGLEDIKNPCCELPISYENIKNELK